MTRSLCSCPRPQPIQVPGEKASCTRCGGFIGGVHWRHRQERNAGKRAEQLRRRRARG